jgi:hypothetical protein
MKFLRVTEVFALEGAVDYSFCDEESKWRGSAVHDATMYLDRGTLDRKGLPSNLHGYVEAYERFKHDTHFVPLPDGIEVELENSTLGLRGRVDRIGLMRGKKAIADLKTGAIHPIVDIQMALYG